MKLWLLETISLVEYDDEVGYVVRAETELNARVLASGGMSRWKVDSRFLNPSQTRCTEVLSDGEEEIILRSYSSA